MENSQKIIYVDVGAWGGGCCGFWAKDKAIDMLYAFEPNKNIFPCLKKTASRFKNIKVFEEAITNLDGFMTFYENSTSDTGSLLPLDDEGSKKWGEITKQEQLKTKASYLVKCVKLKTFMDRENIDHINFLKIDTQGQDFEAVKSLEEKIKNIKRIYLEVQIADFELYKGQSKKKEVVEYMEKYGFVQKFVIGQCNKMEENILFENKNIDLEPLCGGLCEAFAEQRKPK